MGREPSEDEREDVLQGRPKPIVEVEQDAVLVFPARAREWRIFAKQAMRRAHPNFQLGYSLLIVGCVVGIVSAAAAIDIVQGSPNAWNPLAALGLTAASFGLVFWGATHLGRFGPAVQWGMVIVVGALPVFANATAWIWLLAR